MPIQKLFEHLFLINIWYNYLRSINQWIFILIPYMWNGPYEWITMKCRQPIWYNSNDKPKNTFGVDVLFDFYICTSSKIFLWSTADTFGTIISSTPAICSDVCPLKICKIFSYQSKDGDFSMNIKIFKCLKRCIFTWIIHWEQVTPAGKTNSKSKKVFSWVGTHQFSAPEGVNKRVLKYDNDWLPIWKTRFIIDERLRTRSAMF